MGQDNNTTYAEYDVSKIEFLEGLEPVRKRPGMYVGDTEDGSGAVNMVLELVDEALAEAEAGFGRVVEVELGAEGWVEVRDCGRGIPVAVEPRTGVSVMELALTQLCTVGWVARSFADDRWGSCLGNLGAAIVNGLSARMEVESHRDGRCWMMAFERGRAVEPLRDCGATSLTGVRVRFWHDPEIFTGPGVDVQALLRKLEVRAAQSAGVRLDVSWPQGQQTIHFPAGVADLVQMRLEASQERLLKASLWSGWYEGGFKADVALGWHSGFGGVVFSSVNAGGTVDGGTHVEGVLEGLVAVVERAARKSGRWSEAFHGERLSPLALMSGLGLGVSVLYVNPKFASATWDRLASPDVRGALKGFVEARLGAWLADRPELFEQVMGRALEAQAVVHRMSL